MTIKITKIEGTFTNGRTGRNNKVAYVAENDKGQYGHLPNENKPYMPIGGRLALNAVKDILIFR